MENENIELLKELLEAGVITQEEFDAKEKQLLSQKDNNKDENEHTNKNDNLNVLKELLEAGVLTQEEYAAKKKQIEEINNKKEHDLSVIKYLFENDILTEGEYEEKRQKIQSATKEDTPINSSSAIKVATTNSIDPIKDQAAKKKTKLYLYFACGIAALIILFVIIKLVNNNNPVVWNYDKAKTQEITYGKVTAYVPDDWKVFEYENGIDASKRDKVWFVIESRGKMSSMGALLYDLESDEIPMDGASINKNGCQYAYKINEYTNKEGQKVNAYAYIIDGEGYWVAGGADEESMNRSAFNELFGNIQCN